MQRENETLRGQLTVVVCCIVILAMAIGQGRIPFYNNDFLEDDSKPFVNAVEFLTKNSKEDGTIVFAGFLKGGKIIFYSHRKLKPIWDDRLELLDKKFLKKANKRLQYGKKWQEFIINTGAQYAIFDAETFGAQQLRRTREWPLVKKFKEKREKVFIYRVPANDRMK